MKYTERFFKFPTRLVDEFERIKIQEEIEKTKKIPDIEPTIKSIDSIYKLHYTEIEGWQEIYPPETSFEDINGKLECTLIFTKTHGDILCSWDVQKFEDKLNKHVETYTEYLKTLIKTESNSIIDPK